MSALSIAVNHAKSVPHGEREDFQGPQRAMMVKRWRVSAEQSGKICRVATNP